MKGKIQRYKQIFRLKSVSANKTAKIEKMICDNKCEIWNECRISLILSNLQIFKYLPPMKVVYLLSYCLLLCGLVGRGHTMQLTDFLFVSHISLFVAIFVWDGSVLVGWCSAGMFSMLSLNILVTSGHCNGQHLHIIAFTIYGFSHTHVVEQFLLF